ncbi:uncharacterized protein LOC143465803 isoform X3 [Clavelina lepadiformis]|uniref:uncharacterized protein LOC143465803 isoform X3 n=1 Tax=Clavelina lepadiformis TaxID=159417 RepID=UPI0040425AE4
MNDSDAGMTAEDLKRRLYQSMRSTGLLRQLQGQLRQSMINELRSSGKRKPLLPGSGQPSDLIAATIKQPTPKMWTQQVMDNLVFHHLKQSRYHYALSLFKDEASVSFYKQELTNELLERLGLQSTDVDVTMETPESSASEDFPQCSSTPNRSKDHLPLLWSIMEKISMLAAGKFVDEKEKKFAAEVEKSPPKTLGEKLRAIDEELKLSSRPQPHNPASTISSYTVAVRKAEECAERRYRSSFEQWKDVELSKMRLEESKKMKDAIDARCKELEGDYQVKRNALLSRERSAVERMNNQRELMEKEMHDQRQSLLRELDQIRAREDILHQRERFINSMEETKLREVESMRDQIHPKPPTLRQEPKQSSVPQGCKKTEESDEVKRILLQMEEKIKESDQLRAEVARLKTELSQLKLKEDEESEKVVLRTQLKSLVREVEDLKRRGVEAEKASEVERWRTEIEDLRKARAEQDVHQRQLGEALKEMKKALDDSNKALVYLSQQSSERPRDQPRDFLPLPTKPAPPHRGAVEPIREYEAIQTSSILLHPGLSASNKDPPFLDTSVASAGVRMDVRQRLKDLEAETSNLDEQYQRYLHRNYRDTMQNQSKLRTSRMKETPIPQARSLQMKSPNKGIMRKIARTSSAEGSRSSDRDDGSLLMDRPSHEAEELLTQQTQYPDFQRQPEVSATTIHPNSTLMISHPDMEDKPGKRDGDENLQQDGIASPPSLKLAIGDVATDGKSSSEESSDSPKLDTARRTNPAQVLPPIRTRLPPVDEQQNLTETLSKKDEDVGSKLDDAGLHQKDGGTLNFEETLEHKIHSPGGSFASSSEQKDAPDEVKELVRDISSISDEISPSQSDLSNKELSVTNKPELKSEDSLSLKESLKKTSEELSYSSNFTESEKKAVEVEHKNFDDMTFSDDDISAALRWGKNHQPKLDSDDGDIPRVEDLSKEDEIEELISSVKEERDVFELSDEQLSLDSTGSRKTNPSKEGSDESSW